MIININKINHQYKYLTILWIYLYANRVKTSESHTKSGFLTRKIQDFFCLLVNCSISFIWNCLLFDEYHLLFMKHIYWHIRKSDVRIPMKFVFYLENKESESDVQREISRFLPQQISLYVFLFILRTHSIFLNNAG